MNDHASRFGGISRLFADAGLERLRRAHVCVVGIGGVGSWAVEALARSGIGALTLIDLDDICVTNINRQLHALDGSIGRPKVDAMAERVRAINPGCIVRTLHTFFTEANAEEILQTRFDYVLDAIDNPVKKSLLIAACHQRSIPVFVVGGAGGRPDATALKITDLTLSTHDRLLTEVRSLLRAKHQFPRGKKSFGIPCVHVGEPALFPQSDGTVCERREEGSSLRLTCASGYGTACFVTGAFGFAAAGHIVRAIAAGNNGAGTSANDPEQRPNHG